MDDLHKLECVAFRYIRWPDLIIELGKAGWCKTDIARALAVPLTTVASWESGNHEPRYSSGEALLLLHQAVFGSEYTKNRINYFRKCAIKAPATAGQ